MSKVERFHGFEKRNAYGVDVPSHDGHYSEIGGTGPGYYWNDGRDWHGPYKTRGEAESDASQSK